MNNNVIAATVFMMVASVAFCAPAPARTETTGMPSVEAYLTLSRSERIKWFANGKFRRKMLDHGNAPGTGLLSRWVSVEKIPNFRDVGGLKTLDGHVLKRGLLYRCAGLNDNAKTPSGMPKEKWSKGRSRLTENGRIAIKKLGIRTDLDLRTPKECWGMTGSPIGDEVKWVNISFGAYDFRKKKWTRDAVKAVFSVLSDKKNYPIVFHCIGGADRTGCLAMMIETLCGVDEEDAVKDWELTGASTARANFVHERTINKFLARLSEFPGDTAESRMRAFLTECGVTDAQMDKVRRIMRDD